MKCNFLLFFLFCGLLNLNAQKNQLLEKIDESIAQIEAINNLSKLKIEISTAEQKPFDENDSFNYQTFNRVSEKIDNEKLRQFFSELSVFYSISSPYTFISLKPESYDLIKILGKQNFYFMNNPDKEPVFKPLSVTFTDGTERKIDREVVSKESLSKKYMITVTEDGETFSYPDISKATEVESFLYENSNSFTNLYYFENTKPVAKIEFEIVMPNVAAQYETLETKKDHINTPYGKIQLIEIKENAISYIFPSDMDKSLEVFTLHKNGKALAETGANSHTVISDEQKSRYSEIIEFLRQTRKEVEKGNIKNEKELQDYYSRNSKQLVESNADLNKVSLTQKTVRFKGPVSKVVFAVPGQESSETKFTINYSMVRTENQNDYEVASDFETEKRGIIGKNGKWLVKPIMDSYFRQMNRTFFTDQINDINNTYHFNGKNNQLIKVAYQLDEIDIYNEKYVIIERGTNGLEGVANAETGEIILPMEYDFINFKDGFWIASKNDKEGAMDNNFKEIIPFIFDNVEFRNSYFSVSKEDGSKEDIYSRAGVNISKGQYTDFEGEFNSERILAEKYIMDKQKGTSWTDYYFLDEQGTVIIDVQKNGWQDPKPFSSGLALVKDKKTQLFGFIDTVGKVVIPFIFVQGNSGFIEKSGLAPVRMKDGQSVLIDKKGKVVKTLNGRVEWVIQNPEDDRYINIDDKWYDAFGEPVEDKPQKYYEN